MSMDKQTETLRKLNFSKNGLIIAFILLTLFLLSLVTFSVLLIAKYADPSLQKQAIILVVFLPLIGLAIATAFLWRSLEKLSFSKSDRCITLMKPEEQRKKLNEQIKELASILEMEDEDLSNLRAAYVLAEDLALRQIEQEKKVPLKRHVKVAGAEFDAAFLDKNYSTLVEVTFVVNSSISKEKIDKILEKVEKARKKFEEIKSGRKVKLLLAIVTQIEKEAEKKLKESLLEKLSTVAKVDIDVRLLDFEALQKNYTED